jgi:HEAT repeat protein
VRIARNDSSVRARKEAARRLAECRGRSATDALLACALNDIVVVQVVALEALTVHAHELSAASIVPLLENKHSSVRMRAAELLGEVGDASSVGALIAVLHDDAWVVRVSSAEALVKIGDPQALQPLRELREHSGRFSRRGLDTMIFELESRTTKQR